VTKCRAAGGLDLRSVTNYPREELGERGEMPVAENERAHQVAVRRSPVPEMCPQGLVQRGIAGREHSGVVDEPVQVVGDG
jgi:hypothetical protein